MTQRYRWIQYSLVALMAGSLLVVTGCGGGGGGARPVLALSPTALNFTAVEGQGNPDPQTFEVQNTGGGTLKWTATVEAGKTWVTVNPAAGEATKEAPSLVQVAVNIADLTAGTHTAKVTVARAGDATQSAELTVTLNLAAAPKVKLSTAALNFTAVEGQGNPAPQTFQVQNEGGGTLNWTATKDQAWLTLGKTSGSATQAAPDTVQVSVDATGLAFGTYNAQITVSQTGKPSDSATIAVTLRVKPDEAPQLSALSFDPATARWNAQAVTVRSEVTDDAGIVRVWGDVWQGETKIADLPEQTPNAARYTYSASIALKINDNTDGTADVYTIKLRAQDTKNPPHEVEVTADYSVPAPMSAPSGPPF